MERSFVMVKPDGVQRGLVGEVISRLERRGLKLVACRLLQIPTTMAEEHYGQHRDRPFFGELIQFITSGPVVAMVWEGPGAIDLIRTTMGATNPAAAGPGTIRGDLAVDIGHNVVHGSDSPEAAEKEIALFFGPDPIDGYVLANDPWIVGG